jgi:hypothetical protein
MKWLQDHPLFAAVRSNELYLKTESTVVFLCGAISKDGKRSARDILLDYAVRHLSDFTFFRAEDAIQQITHEFPSDLLSIEGALAGYADCIVIILESPSAIAELGAFSNVRQLAKIILAINDVRYKNEQSFISLGPLRHIARVSLFGAPLHTSFTTILECAALLEDRLNTIRRKRAVRLSLADRDSFNNATPKHRLLFVADVISLLSPTTVADVKVFFQALYGKRPGKRLSLDIGMLEALKLSTRRGSFILRSPARERQFVRYPGDSFASFRSRMLKHYLNTDPRRLRVMKEYVVDCVNSAG